ncbi:hypothetical protein ACS0TY_000130 [Phlomoides rotata]
MFAFDLTDISAPFLFLFRAICGCTGVRRLQILVGRFNQASEIQSMGFQFHAIKLPRAISISFIVDIFTSATLLFISALSYLGLYKPPPEENPDSTTNSNNYILILDGSSPSLVPIPVQVVTAAIKNRVPVLRYRDSILHRKHEDESEQLKVCTICLEFIDGDHEIRELCNCSHLFHRECLDTWIDEGQVSCPLCRSMLLPPKVNLIRCHEYRDRVQHDNAHFVSS